VATSTVGPKNWSFARVLAVTTGLALILFWLWIFSGAPRKQNPDYLEDRAWAERTEATCAATVARIDDLPAAPSAGSSSERAAVVDRANDELEAMLDELDVDLPSSQEDVEVVRPWLADWRTYLANRRDYADRLRTDPDAQLLVDEKFRDSIETVIGTFAEVNEMDSCVVPGDVG
jgi:hypothetical protein